MIKLLELQLLLINSCNDHMQPQNTPFISKKQQINGVHDLSLSKALYLHIGAYAANAPATTC
jgi:hypothetical protein